MPYSKFGAFVPKIVHVASGSPVTVSLSDAGAMFTNLGASGSITFNLPAPTAEATGVYYEFVTVSANAIVIGVTGNDKLIIHGDVGADTITTAATIGQHFKVTCVGSTGWFVQSDPSVASAGTAVTAVTIAT